MYKNRHNVFISYHDKNDREYRDKFEKLFHDTYDLLISKSVQDGDIAENEPADNVQRIIRDDYLRDSTVTVVLIGTETWKRKHVDWEIASSIRKTKYSSRSGLIGLLLPSRADFKTKGFTRNTIPPRLYDNQKCGYAKIYNWSTDPDFIHKIIHEAFLRRDEVLPVNSRTLFVNNRSSDKWED
ncbi:TIR domain-containing protein [Acinetobacter baumannii]|uniref:TIR domain-containing protein n=1 Tax=Acinetobacter baumannii TaxID=470 RepID=UPI0021B250DE|nr:TIR domain-containing protein [Acinetobacter baumannii]MDQ8912679.1 TIR domain-containing protein [Acinetobacter baumannii]MDQ9997321.1 TIR domain-containing protein [Acinetobacter baumannii]MEB6558621.1 TIR domain-containing protein [Acinetobacter baumannii]UWZ63644.1 TIR domain-containing protein [Acinetobacter baumannii]